MCNRVRRGSIDRTRLATMVEEFIATQGLDISLEYGAYPDRPYDSPAVWGDASRITEIVSRASTF